MQPADRIHRRAPVDGEVGHVERLGGTIATFAPQREQIVRGDAQLARSVIPKVPLDQIRGEAVEARRYRSVRGEKIACPGDGQRCPEIMPGFLHAGPRPLKDGKSSMALIQMADLGPDAQRRKQLPSADSQHHLLLEPQLGPAAIQLAGNAAMGGIICRIVAIEQVKRGFAHLHLPGAQPY